MTTCMMVCLRCFRIFDTCLLTVGSLIPSCDEITFPVLLSSTRMRQTWKQRKSTSVSVLRIAEQIFAANILCSKISSTCGNALFESMRSSSDRGFTPLPRFFAFRRSISSPSRCFAIESSHVLNRAPRVGSYLSIHFESSARVSCVRSCTVSTPTRPLPHF